jgi:hypothetical protein
MFTVLYLKKCAAFWFGKVNSCKNVKEWSYLKVEYKKLKIYIKMSHKGKNRSFVYLQIAEQT